MTPEEELLNAEPVYRALTTPALERIRAAFLGDKEQSHVRAAKIAFIDGRIALIDRILQERQA